LTSCHLILCQFFACLPIIIDIPIDQTYILVLIPKGIIGVDGSMNGTQIRTSKVRFQMSDHALFNPSEPYFRFGLLSRRPAYARQMMVRLEPLEE
jgi:hypothetical protein